MGTFLGYYGERKIPEGRREEFEERLLRLLDQGGMLQAEEVNLYGKRVFLLKKLEPDCEDNTVSFCYNYFEDSTWETAGYERESMRFFSNKVGTRQFNLICSAAYVLTEFYAETFGVAEQDGRVYAARDLIGWMNYLFRETYTNRRVQDPWAIFRLLPDHMREADLFALIPQEELYTMSPRGSLKYMAVAQHEEFEKALDAFEREETPKYGKVDVLRLAVILRREMKKVKAMPGSSDAEKLAVIRKILLRIDIEPYKKADSPYSGIYLAAMLLPLEVTIEYAAEIFGLDFWELLSELEDKLPADAGGILSQEGAELKPVPEISTAELLRRTDDDRAFWWEADGDVRFSEEMTAWLQELREELNALTGEKRLSSVEFTRLMVDTLYKINQDPTANIVAFQTMFYDFLIHGEDAMPQAAIRLLVRLFTRYQDEEDPKGNQKLRRYLAVLGNLPLRKTVFGF